MNKKIIVLLFSCFLLTGCNLLPKINFGTPGTMPQSTQKSKAREICKGKSVWSDTGVLLSCSKEYINYAENYDKQERRQTIVERIKSFVNNLMGWGFWGFVLLLILCPSVIGLVAGRLIEGTVGIAKKALNSTVRAVQKTRKNGANLNDTLLAEQDEDVKKYIAKLKEQEKIK